MEAMFRSLPFLARQCAAAASRSQTSTRALSSQTRILITGANGQIGSELVPFLRERFGAENVVASDIKGSSADGEGPFMILDVSSHEKLADAVKSVKPDWVIHLASILSAVGEQNPQLAMSLNTRSMESVLELGREHNLRVFAPSSIAVFGPSTPQDNTPDETIMRPTTIYGVTKVYGELLGEYYHQKFGVDFRSIRYPGIISSVAMPGGGTTDFAVEIYHEALKAKKYDCFLNDATKMPMLYMPDCLEGTLNFLEAPNENLTQRTYNLTGFSFTPKEQAASICKVIPEFEITYNPDFRQAIADTWPRSIDDSAAGRDWNWRPQFTLDTMTEDMLKALAPKYAV